MLRKCTSKASHQKSALAVADIAMGSVKSLLGNKWSSQYGLLGWRVGNQREMGCVKVKQGTLLKAGTVLKGLAM